MRRSDWPERLNDFISSVIACNRPFAWGIRDCATFCGGAVLAMTGVDYFAPYRGAYSSYAGAKKFLHLAGGYEAHVGKLLGSSVAVNASGRGDVVLRQADGRETLGIILGEKAVFLTEKGGLAFLSVDNCVSAWKVL